ncbi:MAG: T9SS type A sorting domain-containing protein [Chitinophagales bacterium]
MKNSFLCFYLFVSVTVFSQSATWNSNVANIIFENCGTCHHPGGIAPFSLITYSEAYENADDIAEVVEERKMPPWLPDPNYVHFAGEKVLTEEEMNTLVAWAEAGAPVGTGTAPEVPVYEDGELMDAPEQVIQLPTYEVQLNTDEYRTFVLHSDLTETKYISEMEFVIANSSAVHHILFFHDTSNISFELDLADPFPGYASNGTTTSSPYAKLIAGWAPGENGVFKLPYGMGFEVPAGSDFVVEIHFAPGSEGQKDSTKINLKYSDAVFTRPVWVDPILYHFPPVFQEPLFYIPANEIVTFNEVFENIAESYGVDLTFISASPHMHLLGETFKAYAISPDGDTTRFIYIPDWDFHWQNAFVFQKPLRIKQGSDIYGTATYNNTSENENNPTDPPQDVFLGEQTTDEMMLCFFAYTFYLPGDEDIIMDSSILSSTMNIEELKNVHVFPNPATDLMQVQFYDNSVSNFNIKVYDIFGREALSMYHLTAQQTIDISGWDAGMYAVEVNAGGKKKIFKIIKQNE